MTIGIIHDDDINQKGNNQRAQKIAGTISDLCPNDHIVWSNRHDFGYQMLVKDTILKFLKDCERVFVILAKKWTRGHWKRNFPSIVIEADSQNLGRHKITFILLDEVKVSRYKDFSIYNTIEIDQISNITDAIKQNFINCIESSRERITNS